MVQQPNNSQVVKMAIVAIAALAFINVSGSAVAQKEMVSTQTSLIVTVHEDASVTLKYLNGDEIKGFANVEALAGSNGLVDLINQMELWN